jgi:adenylate cyclase
MKEPMPNLRDLPPRVRDAIDEQQHSSEILLCWAQLSIVGAFTILYALSPRAPVIAQTFEPVPFALAAYFAFTLVRIALAYMRKLPPWFVYLSIIIDMMLLMVLIWSFHLQYRQPPSFYLKSPTLLYVFIFIALRALYFEYRFVAFSGAIAALGWLLLVLYAITKDPSDTMITRDYVQYITSNSVLLGAEFDKIISIAMVTGILVLAIKRSHRLLLRSVTEGITAEELKRFVPDAVARQAAASEHLSAGDGEVREATIFFSDIENFTALSESLAPSALIKLLNEYFALVTEPIERHGGVINQYQGDAILASFNLPNALDDHADAAIEAALAIQRSLKTHPFGNDGGNDSSVSIVSRIGINTGIVIGGLVGNQNRLGYTLHGDDVNLAARLEQLNKDLGTRIVVSERTRELARKTSAQFESKGEHRVRGRNTLVHVYSVSELEEPMPSGFSGVQSSP